MTLEDRHKLGRYMVDYAARKVPHRLGPFDDQGIPQFDVRNIRLRGAPVYHPIVIIQYALAHYDLALDGNVDAEVVFLRCARWLEDHAQAEPQHHFLIWPYDFPLRTPRVPAPFISGLAQGQALSVLARAYQITGSAHTLEVAQRAANSFLYSVEDGGLLTVYSDTACFFEEVAAAPKISILNGCLYALFSLWEFLSVSPDAALQRVCENCIRGIEATLPEYDLGWWSRYSTGLRWNIAPVYYHTTHIRQLRHLSHVLNNRTFGDYADRWDGYYQSRYNRVRQRVVEFIGTNLNRSMTLAGLESAKYREPQKANP